MLQIAIFWCWFVVYIRDKMVYNVYLTAGSDKEMRNSLMVFWLTLKPYKYSTCRALMWTFSLILL